MWMLTMTALAQDQALIELTLFQVEDEVADSLQHIGAPRDLSMARLALMHDARADILTGPTVTASVGQSAKVVTGALQGGECVFELVPRLTPEGVDLQLDLAIDDESRFDVSLQLTEGQTTLLRDRELVLLVRARSIHDAADMAEHQRQVTAERERYDDNWSGRSARWRARALDHLLEPGR